MLHMLGLSIHVSLAACQVVSTKPTREIHRWTDLPTPARLTLIPQ